MVKQNYTARIFHCSIIIIPGALNGLIGLKLIRFDYQLDVSADIFAAQNNVAPGEITTPGYAYFNAFIKSPSYKINFTDCRIILGVQNLTNKSYRNHLSTNRGFIREEPGRNFYLKLNITW
ncbi:MAG: TonB-dependent receptor [Ignavibacteriaceae bacterium]